MTDPMVEAVKALSDASIKGDRALLELIQAVIIRLTEVEGVVKLLSELHKQESEEKAFSNANTGTS